MLPEVVSLLACPACGAGLVEDGGSLVCGAGHRFDVARQGYVNLLRPGANTGTADTAEMVQARERFLSGGHYAPLVAAVAETVAARGGDVVVDAGAGTAHYTAAVVETLGGAALGIALDVSKYAARRAARAHPRIGAVVCDVWQGMPLQSDAADVVLGVFAPRNVSETARVLRPGGAYVIAAPTAEHLHEIVGPLGMVTVDEQKRERLERDLAGWRRLDHTHVRFTMQLDADALAALVRMGPSGHHLTEDEVRSRVAAATTPTSVTCAVDVAAFTPEV